MIFRKNLRAGTLLYALLILGIFSLLVQFYLQSQLAAGHAWQAKKLEGQAYFMAQMARDEYLKAWEEGKEENPSPENKEAKGEEDQTKAAEPKVQAPTSGQVSFTAGQATYTKQDSQLQVQVQLDSGQAYTYQFPIPSEK